MIATESDRTELTASGPADNTTRSLIIQFALYHIAAGIISLVLTESAAALPGVRVLLLPVLLIHRKCADLHPDFRRRGLRVFQI